MKIVWSTILCFLLSFPAMALDFSTLLGQASQFGTTFSDPYAGPTAFPSLLIPSGGLYEAMGTAYTAMATDSG